MNEFESFESFDPPCTHCWGVFDGHWSQAERQDALSDLRWCAWLRARFSDAEIIRFNQSIGMDLVYLWRAYSCELKRSRGGDEVFYGER